MLSFQQFIELQVVGLLLLFALYPLVVAVTPGLRGLRGMCPGADNLSTTSAVAAAVFVSAFVVGVAGNQLIDIAVGAAGLEGDEWPRPAYQAWADSNPAAARQLLLVGLATGSRFDAARDVARDSVAGTNATGDGVIRVRIPADLVPTLKVAEYVRGDLSPSARAYFERHKSLLRVLRGTAAAALLLLLTMLSHDLIRRREGGRIERSRYRLGTYVASGAILLVMSAAYRSESKQYYERVCELATWERARCEPPSGVASDRVSFDSVRIAASERRSGAARSGGEAGTRSLSELVREVVPMRPARRVLIAELTVVSVVLLAKLVVARSR